MTEQYDIFRETQRITDWLIWDHPNTDFEDAMQLMKIGEELGEAIEAFFRYHGQNKRKEHGADSKDEVLSELADVFIATLCVIQRFAKTSDSGQQIIKNKIKMIKWRAGIEEA